MARLNFLNYCKQLLFPLLLLLATGPARAQTQAGNGLMAEYYRGTDFTQFMRSRVDATISFDWAHQPPIAGMPAEYFSVRWTGWLRVPTSGRYVFHVTVDDGMRIWLNDRLILDEWRPQPISRFTTSAELKAGEPYKLRVEYFQDILDTRAQLTWERPDVPLAPPPSSWRNLWGLNADDPKPEPIPTQFLFVNNPRPAAARPVPAVPKPPTVAKTPASAKPPVPAPAKATPRPQPPRRVTPATPILAKPAVVSAAPIAPPALVLADSDRTARLATLAVGEAVTLPDLYFDQGQARLLPAVRTALDGLAAILHAQPTLRFEVQGHTDNVGNAELNRQLSQQRAEAVCLYLTAHGAAEGQLRPVGYGGTQPVADNADPAQRPRNRRVALRRL
ncbi:PA14 domain-containing protein [Hymenobacter ruricola]|nr:PA14 domain-containing protein [Hymenobacter ruricola]